MSDLQPPLDRWTELAGHPVRPLDGGLINETFVVGAPPVAVVQRQHAMFPAEVNEDIDAVTRHVEASGLVTPRLLRTNAGAACVTAERGRVWRALTWVPGRTVDAVDGPAMAAEAGAMVARWHRATADLEHAFAFSRPGAHDTDAHMGRLRQALEVHAGHRLAPQVRPVAERILAGWEAWDGRLDGAPRIAHGDLKISNLRFDPAGRAVCLLDFDTLGLLPLDIELGDAARSWCNPAGEDTWEARFDVATFEAAFGAYVAESPLSAEDRAALVAGVERICLELASRFAADALQEAYFGWKPAVAPTWGDHNLMRASGQVSLAESVKASRAALESALR